MENATDHSGAALRYFQRVRARPQNMECKATGQVSPRRGTWWEFGGFEEEWRATISMAKKQRKDTS